MSSHFIIIYVFGACLLNARFKSDLQTFLQFIESQTFNQVG